MTIKKFLLLCAAIFTTCRLSAQQAFPVTEQQPQLIDGLTIGYNIKSTELKKVGDKGDFSRYSVRFFVSNTSSEAKIMLYKQGWNIGNSVSDQLVQFNCINATGARLTSKSATIRAEPCNVMALVDDKAPGSNKSVQNKRLVQIGYWIKPGQTISADVILIVPLNEQPNIQAIYLADQLQYTASASFGNGPEIQPVQQNQSPPPMPQATIPAGFAKIRNLYNNTYINIETGPIRTSPITGDWWSAQWALTPVPGTDYFNIKNKWKGNFINADNGLLNMSGDAKAGGSLWLLVPTRDGSGFRIKNARSGAYLCIAPSSQLIVSNGRENEFSSAWAIQ